MSLRIVSYPDHHGLGTRLAFGCQSSVVVVMIQECLSRPADILRLAAELYARGLINKSTNDAAVSGESPTARAEILLTALERRIVEDPVCTGEVIKVFKTTGNYSLVEIIESKWGQLSFPLSGEESHPKG